jgi:hypothetical protein
VHHPRDARPADAENNNRFATKLAEAALPDGLFVDHPAIMGRVDLPGNRHLSTRNQTIRLFLGVA